MNDYTVWRPYCQMKTAPAPIEVIAAEGNTLVTAKHGRLLDGMASWWSACHGHRHPHIVQAIQTQMDKLPHVMFGGITHEGAERLATRLTKIVPGELSHVFFADSGSVAVEVAMKMAMGVARRRGHSQRRRFLAFDHAYHGDTTGAMSLCDPQRSMHRQYSGGILQQFHCPLPRNAQTYEAMRRLLEVNQEQIAGIFVEPLVQGAGGMRFHDPVVLDRIREACDHFGMLMIVDEIATGFARTGTLFAMQQADVDADIVCVGKALTAGTLTMAATLARPEVFDAFWSDDSSDALMHGPTFMANPLACAAANASLDLFESQPRCEQAQVIGETLRRVLAPARCLPGVTDVRTFGAIGVIEMEKETDWTAITGLLLRRGVWLRPFGKLLYTTPPLTLNIDEITQIGEAMVAAITELGSSRSHRTS